VALAVIFRKSIENQRVLRLFDDLDTLYFALL
jgi:hypothetical protein